MYLKLFPVVFTFCFTTELIVTNKRMEILLSNAIKVCTSELYIVIIAHC